MKVICTSGFQPPYSIFDTIVLQSGINEATFELLYNALMVSKTQLVRG